MSSELEAAGRAMDALGIKEREYQLATAREAGGNLESFVSTLAEEGRIQWRNDAPIFWGLVEAVREANENV